MVRNQLYTYASLLFVPRKLTHRSSLQNLVSVQGFEPWTPSSQTRCATRLRYTEIKTGAPWQNRTAVTWLQNRCNAIILIGRNLVLSTRIELVMDAYQASVIPFNYKRILVPRDGIEPPTHRFSIYCSTNWATSAKIIGVSYENWTHDDGITIRSFTTKLTTP